LGIHLGYSNSLQIRFEMDSDNKGLPIKKISHPCGTLASPEGYAFRAGEQGEKQ
jgi:hypothetical protein